MHLQSIEPSPSLDTPSLDGSAVVVRTLRIVNAYVAPGYLPGARQPSFVLELVLPSASTPETVLEKFDGDFATATESELGKVNSNLDEYPLLFRVASAAQWILSKAGLPLYTPPALIARTKDDRALRLALPSYGTGQETLRAFAWAGQLMNLCLLGRSTEPHLASLGGLITSLSSAAPRGINSIRFLDAANAANIPWRHVWGNVVQFGWGSQSRRMDSSFTHATPAVSTSLARNKRATASVLREAGVPVPPHEVAQSPDDAVRIANGLGYPVVVKPADLDGGRGVGAGLRDEAAVRKAYELARALSTEVLVEKHVNGNDYRLQVFEGKVFWAVERVPGGVTGDGARTIEELLAELNANPLRGPRGSAALLKRVDLDDEAQELLAEQGLTADAVPPRGRFVRLRRAANVASGGYPQPVLEKTHPDNLALAVRAASVMGLDLAGIDMLIPDISRSWLETGAGICDVNAQPQMSPHLPAYVLQRMFPECGRIPVVMVLGGNDGLLGELAQALGDFGHVGTSRPGAVSVAGRLVSRLPGSSYEAGVALLCDPEVDLAIINVQDGSVLRNGLPVDAFDVLVFPDPGDVEHLTGDKLRALAGALAASCRGPFIVDANCPRFANGLPPRNILSVPTEALCEAVRRQISGAAP